VDIVDPRHIASNFASILEKPVIATNGTLLFSTFSPLPSLEGMNEFN
jgi:hypothetical protein